MTTPSRTPLGSRPGGLAVTINRIRGRHGPRLALAVTLVTVGAIVACDDLTHRDRPQNSRPRRDPGGTPRREVSPSPAGFDSPDDPTIPLVFQDTTDGTMGVTGTSVNYPKLTAVRVVARGLVSRVALYPLGTPFTAGPSGKANFGWSYGGVYSGTKILGVGATSPSTRRRRTTTSRVG